MAVCWCNTNEPLFSCKNSGSPKRQPFIIDCRIQKMEVFPWASLSASTTAITLSRQRIVHFRLDWQAMENTNPNQIYSGLRRKLHERPQSTGWDYFWNHNSPLRKHFDHWRAGRTVAAWRTKGVFPLRCFWNQHRPVCPREWCGLDER